MTLATATLPNGKTVHCLNAYEIDFSIKEIFNEDLTDHGLDLPADGVYYDVGGNIGLFALYLNDKCPEASIYSYEPIPAVFEALERNLSGLSGDCHAIQLGLGAERGDVVFDYYPGITGLSGCNAEAGEVLSEGLRSILTGGDNNYEPEFVDGLLTATKVECQITRLSDELAARGHDTIDLLKIDTEGSEEDVLAGLDAGDWPKIRQLMVEVHLGRQCLDQMQKRFQKMGYSTSTSDHPMAHGGAPVFHLYAKRA